MFAPGIPHGPPRIGYCCLYRSPAADAKDEARFNVTGTTVTALQRMERAAAFEKVLALVARNLVAMEAHLRRVATASPVERMLRLDGNVLPAFTHPMARWMYDEPAMRELVEAGLGAAGGLLGRAGCGWGCTRGRSACWPALIRLRWRMASASWSIIPICSAGWDWRAAGIRMGRT